MIYIGKFYFGSKKRTVNQSLSKSLLFVLTFYCFFSSALAQNEILARIEFESAEELYVQERYIEALKKIEKTGVLLEKWTPKVSYLKIQVLRQLADFEDVNHPETVSLLNETSAYFDFYKANPDDIILDKFKIVYEIDNDLLFVKSVKSFKDTEEYIAGDKAYKQGDFGEAIKWFRAGAEKGNPACMNYLGIVYENGYGIHIDNTEAKRWFQMAVERDYPLAMYNLGSNYLGKNGSNPDFNEAMQLFLKSSDLGFSEAMYKIGAMYQEGLGVDQDYNLAKEWYQKASDKGHSTALWSLGNFYSDGLGVHQDLKKAFDLNKASAQKGNTFGMTTLGYLYATGKGVEKNLMIANEWFKKAADNGNSTAMSNLGMFYRDGSGVERDYFKAVDWFNKAIESGNVNALKYLADMYSTGGNGLKKDKKKSQELMAKFEAVQK